jgi:hypothetical protein
MRRPIVLAPVVAGVVLAVLLAGCGGAGKATPTAKKPAPARRPSVAAWQPGTPAPKVTPALITQAEHGLTDANTNLGTVDEVFGSVPAKRSCGPLCEAAQCSI